MSSRKEAIANSIKYFEGDTLAADVITDKYYVRSKLNREEYLEDNPEQLLQRLRNEFKRIDPNLTEEELQKINFDFIVPQGSVLFGLGNKEVLSSLSNCVVVASPQDSMSNIMDTAKDLANLFKRRAGVGLDLSELRPEGSLVGNSAGTSTGAWSFAELYSNITRMVGQSNRRGALMVAMDIKHPDIEKFITCKLDKTKVTGANISVKISNEFMEAVVDDEDFNLCFPIDSNNVYKTVRARDLWNLIIRTNKSSAEPGVLFWDTILENLPAQEYQEFKTICTNPCVSGDTWVETSDGPRQVKDLLYKPFEVTFDNKNYKSSGFWSNGKKEVFLITTDAGYAVKCTAEHKIFANGELKKVSDLKIGDKLYINNNQYSWEGEGTFEEGTKFLTNVRTIEKLPEEEVYDCKVEEIHKFSANGIIVSNCGEIPLSAYDSCRLISINLSNFVENPFTEQAAFSLPIFSDYCKLATRLGDDLIDLEIEKLQQIIEKTDEPSEKELWKKLLDDGFFGRRMGIGTHGLADVFAKIGIKYDSEDALCLCDKIYETLRDSCYDESCNLAITRGSFPSFDKEKHLNNEYIKRLKPNTRTKIAETGIRNIALLTQAPTGSISILSRTSSGIEPVFSNSYIRRKKKNHDAVKHDSDFVDQNGDRWEEYKVYHPNVKLFLDKIGSELPPYFVEANDIEWEYRVKLQGTIQKYIDHSISSTINLPKDTDEETISNIYFEAWKNGLKGITVYVEGSRTGVLVKDDDKDKKFVQISAPKRPKELECDIHTVSVKGEKYTIFVGLWDNKPYEVMGGKSEYIEIPDKFTKAKIIKYHSQQSRYDLIVDDIRINNITKIFENKNYEVLTRMLSLALRHGASPNFLVEQLQKDPESEFFSFSRGIARVLKKYIVDGTKVSGDKNCPNCSNDSLRYIEGCVTCTSCGYSKCG